MADGKPSFFKSMMEGIKGYVKGALAGGVVGVISGAAVGALLGAVGLVSLSTGAAAIAGAIWVGSAMAGVGALSGTVTGVVRSREAANPSAQDVLGVAKATFAQGVAVGQQMGQAQAVEAQEQGTRWQDRERQRRAQAAQQSQQLH